LSDPDTFGLSEPQCIRTTVADVATTGTGSTCNVLTYRIPGHLRADIGSGSVVVVTVRSRDVIGFVLRTWEMPSSDALFERLVDIAAVANNVPPLTPAELSIAEWMADRWLGTIAGAVRAIKGPYLSARVQREIAITDEGRRFSEAGSDASDASDIDFLGKIAALDSPAALSDVMNAQTGHDVAPMLERLVRRGLITIRVSLMPTGARPFLARVVMLAKGMTTEDPSLSDPQRRVVQALTNRLTPERAPTVAELAREAHTTRATIERMVSRQWLIAREVRRLRRPGNAPLGADGAPRLNDEQMRAVASIVHEMSARPETRRPILLHGVTGSGKTEVYLAAIEAARRHGRGAILIVPEIALTSQIVDLVSARFGHDVAVLHSRLGQGERYDEWARVADGSASIAIGARSAVFAPVENLGIIIIDEEHEASYKQEAMPRYHARDVAVKRASMVGAVVVLGTATPALESYQAALDGDYGLAVLPRRIGGKSLPLVHVVDMREQFKRAPSVFSEMLTEAIHGRLHRGEQTVLFLNRRGYAQFVLCRDCGYVARCTECSVSLTLHASDRSLRCHHCGATVEPPAFCPDCRGHRLRGFGLGTERVEAEIRQLFPDARLVRMDRDTTQRKDSHSALIRQIRNGEADILIGTQMVAKGFDFPNVTLVGVVSADSGLHIPDFRASERTFQILAQVAGRAGRGSTPGEVIVQTFTPDHYAIKCAARQDYQSFYAKEIEQRRELGYPPFGVLANIVASSEDERTAQMATQAVAAALRDTGIDVEVIGPSPAPLMRLRGRFRWHTVVRGSDRSAVVEACRKAVSSVTSAARGVLTVDIDPTSLA